MGNVKSNNGNLNEVPDDMPRTVDVNVAVDLKESQNFELVNVQEPISNGGELQYSTIIDKPYESTINQNDNGLDYEVIKLSQVIQDDEGPKIVNQTQVRLDQSNNLSKLSNTVKDESQLNVISYNNEDNNSIEKFAYDTPRRNHNIETIDTGRANLFSSSRFYNTDRNMLNGLELTPETRKAMATKYIQSIVRGNLTRRDLEDQGMLLSKRKKVVLSDQGNKTPYVNNFDSEHAPPQASVEFQKKFPQIKSPEVREQLQILGPYIYKKEYVEFEGLPYIGPCMLDKQGCYFGQFKYGYKHGKGKQLFSDGSLYEGYWKEDMANYQGRLIHSNGDSYEGEWFDDKAHGKGIYCVINIKNLGKYCHLDGNSFEGSWFFDQHFGLGAEKFYDKENDDYNRYEGNYWKGKKHGNGRFFWANGSYYRGQFKNDNLHGKFSKSKKHR